MFIMRNDKPTAPVMDIDDGGCLIQRLCPRNMDCYGGAGII